jgi:hypothetical protein
MFNSPRILEDLKDSFREHIQIEVLSNDRLLERKIFWYIASNLQIMADLLQNLNLISLRYFFDHLYSEVFDELCLKKSSHIDTFTKSQREMLRRRCRKGVQRAKKTFICTIMKLWKYAKDDILQESGGIIEEEMDIDSLISLITSCGFEINDLHILIDCQIYALTNEEKKKYDEDKYKRKVETKAREKVSNDLNDHDDSDADNKNDNSKGLIDDDKSSIEKEVDHMASQEEGESNEGSDDDLDRSDDDDDNNHTEDETKKGAGNQAKEQVSQASQDYRKEVDRLASQEEGESNEGSDDDLDRSNDDDDNNHTEDETKKGAGNQAREQVSQACQDEDATTRMRRSKRLLGNINKFDLSHNYIKRKRKKIKKYAVVSPSGILTPLNDSLNRCQSRNRILDKYNYHRYLLVDAYNLPDIFEDYEIDHLLKDFDLLEKCDELDFSNMIINHENISCRKRMLRTLSFDDYPGIGNFFTKLILMLSVNFGIVPKNVFPCGFYGQPDTIDMIKSLPGAKTQHLHTDYDGTKYDPDKNELEYDTFHGASIIFNHTSHSQSIYSAEKIIEIPPLWFIVMRGDFRHAGAPNNNTFPLDRLFLYLDITSGRTGKDTKVFNLAESFPFTKTEKAEVQKCIRSCRDGNVSEDY